MNMTQPLQTDKARIEPIFIDALLRADLISQVPVIVLVYIKNGGGEWLVVRAARLGALTMSSFRPECPVK